MITVIIPNFNGRQYLPSCLKAIPSNIPIIIVDNNSTDDSQKIIRKKLTVIQNHKNLGFGSAVNIGARQAKTKYILVLNNDVKLAANWFKKLIKVISSNPNFFCYTGTVMDSNNSVENTGLVFSMSGRATLRKSTTPGPVWGAPATASVYNLSDFKKLNGFIPHYFAYIEDVDLHYRANKLGLKTYYSSTLSCTHFGGGTAGKHTFFRAKNTFINWIYFIFKNYSAKDILLNLPGIILERLKNFKYLLFCLINNHATRIQNTSSKR